MKRNFLILCCSLNNVVFNKGVFLLLDGGIDRLSSRGRQLQAIVS